VNEEAAQQGDEADEAFGGTNPRAASGARPEVPPNARAVSIGRGHRFAAYPRCSADPMERRRLMARPVWNVIWSIVAMGINIVLLIVLARASLFPSRIFGSPGPSDAIVPACLAAVPIANLVALLQAFMRFGDRGTRLVRIVSWANRVGVVLGVLFGVASAVELTYSSIEIMMTLVLVIPPACTAIALWPAHGGPDVSSAT
jgi:hypothetical protein